MPGPRVVRCLVLIGAVFVVQYATYIGELHYKIIFQLVDASNFLGIESLLSLCLAWVATNLKGALLDCLAWSRVLRGWGLVVGGRCSCPWSGS
jgi:hypothetical protein